MHLKWLISTHYCCSVAPELRNPDVVSTSDQATPSAEVSSSAANYPTSPANLFYQMVQTSAGLSAQPVTVGTAQPCCRIM